MGCIDVFALNTECFLLILQYVHTLKTHVYMYMQKVCDYIKCLNSANM